MERRRLAPVAAGAVAIVAFFVVAPSIPSLATPDRSTDAGTSASVAPATDVKPAIAGFAPGGGVPAADPIPWTGVTWDPIPTTGIETRPGQGVRGLVHVGDLLVARGQAQDPRPQGNPDHLTDVAVVWLSHDGANWDISPIVAGVPPNSVSEITAVAAGPLGVVASGGVCCRVEAPAIWWSADGRSWELSTVAGLARGSYVQGLAAGPDGFVAIGVVGERGAIWTSPDGRTWSEVDPDEA
nr:hypothetical protein [Chloroflexota bacterium]